MERLQKVLAHAGVASRRQSEKMIKAGRVKVNGEVITELGTKVNDDDIIAVDGKSIESEKKVYILLHKPPRTISSVSDPQGRLTVVDWIGRAVKERIYPVGRLDYDTTGALLLTNDGQLTNELLHPRFEFPKIYRATIKGRLTLDQVSRLEEGLMIDGWRTSPAKVSILEENVDQSVVDLTIHEGRKHQVKKMMMAVNHPVKRLHRTHFGPLTVTDLDVGQWRYLSLEEIKALKNNAL